MSQFNRKCLLASAALHALLFLVLLVGPAFFISRQQPPDLPALDIIPAKLIDEAFYRPPSPAPQPQPAKPRPVVRATPPKKATPPPPKAEPKPQTKLTPPNKIKVNTTRISTPQEQSAVEQPSRELAKAAEEIRSLAQKKGPQVPEVSNVSYANYDQMVKSVYRQRWLEPAESSSRAATAVAHIVISRDGTVISAELIRSSGDPNVDGTVRDTLRRVNKLRPFPEGAKEKTRTYTIEFKLTAKR